MRQGTHPDPGNRILVERLSRGTAVRGTAARGTAARGTAVRGTVVNQRL